MSVGDNGADGSDDGAVIPFENVKLLVEHNATDEDTGFQGFVDGDPWKELNLIGPDGTRLLRIKGQAELRRLGLTELFFETDEPENAEVPIGELLAKLPAGTYAYEGKSVDGEKMAGTALLTHDVPAGPAITSPPVGPPCALVDPGNLVISWEPVDESISGSPVVIVAYQLIVEKDVESPHPQAFAQQILSAHLPPSITSMTVPAEFLQPGAPYTFEVLAIEVSGNQTISSSCFETQ